MKKIEAAGGTAQILADVPGIYGGFWTAEDRIVISAGGGLRDLWEVPATGGAVTKLPSVRHNAGGSLDDPILLPDGRHFIYLREDYGGSPSSGIYLGSLDAKSLESAKKLLPDDSHIVYAQSQDPEVGYILFVRSGSPASSGATETTVGALMAQPFNVRKLETVGDPVSIAERVPNSWSGFSVSQTGVLAYRAGLAGAGNQLTWFDRQGKSLGAAGVAVETPSIAISPDGMRVVENRDSQSGSDLWMLDLARGVSTRFTLAGGRYPVWSPDGSRIVFESGRNGQSALYEKLSNGGSDDELLFKSDETKFPIGWSPDGRFLMFATGLYQSWVLRLDGQGHSVGKPYLFVNRGLGGEFSHDMRWVAYGSDESGQYEVYVRPFDLNSANGSPPGAGKWQISTTGGRSPRWNPNGKELFYMASDGAMMTVDITAKPGFQPGTPKLLFKANVLATAVPGAAWDVSPDGKKFLLPIPVAGNANAPYTMVLNWTSLVKK